jgi:hypothetical protein
MGVFPAPGPSRELTPLTTIRSWQHEQETIGLLTQLQVSWINWSGAPFGSVSQRSPNCMSAIKIGYRSIPDFVSLYSTLLEVSE